MSRWPGLAAALLAAGPALAQETAPLRFAPGASGAEVAGRVTGHGYMDYVLRASAGQHISARLLAAETGGHGSVFLNILPPGSEDVAIFVGASDADGDAEDVALPESGAYTLRVYLMGNDRDAGKTVGYRLAVEIR